MHKHLLLLLITLAMFTNLQAQTQEEMMAEKQQKEQELAELKAQAEEVNGKVAALQADVSALTDKLTPYPRWDIGSFGTFGINVANFNDWLSKSKPSTVSTNIGVSFNTFANLQQKKYFWRNNLNLNLGWQKFEDKDRSLSEPKPEFEIASDALNITSLLGYKLNEKLAISTLAEYRTAVLREKLNDPGFLDIGVGMTWTPVTDLVVVVHPLNYNFVFSQEEFTYESSLGAKVVVDYKKEVFPGLAWRSNLSGFLSYSEPSNYSNYTWINGFSTAVNGIGIGLEIGLRNNRQEGYNDFLTKNDLSANAIAINDFDKSPNTGKNPFQTYWVLGLTYNISSK